jgi:integrase
VPHHPHPFYRAARNTWFVSLGGQHHNLGKHPDGLPPPRKRGGKWDAPPPVLAAYYKLMAGRAGPEIRPPGPSPKSGEHPLVAAVLDEFLDWLKHRVSEGTKAQRTFDWYADYLQSFLASLPEPAGFTVDRLGPIDVYRWVDGHPGWKAGKRGAMTAVQRAFRWAAKAGLLKSLGGGSPLEGLEKPGQGRRDLLITAEEFGEILAGATDQAFRDLLEAAWETGARPHELFTVEGRYVDLKGGRWVFPVRESKGKKYQRVVYLTDRGLEITRRLLGRHPTGPLFRGRTGRWTQTAVKCRFQRLNLALGRARAEARGLVPPRVRKLTKKELRDPALRGENERQRAERREFVRRLAVEHGTRYNLYAFRHSFTTRLLEAGTDSHVVSLLLSHRDGTMLARFYSHLSKNKQFLRDQLRGKGA